MERAATRHYNQWLVADPLGRLALDPGGVVTDFDSYRFQRVESRAVSLLLAAIPQNIKEDLITNRWLTSAAVLFRILCLYQPGGSSERAHLLSQLVFPDVSKTYKDAIVSLRRWTQNLQRAREIHATLPDASLLIKGIDAATSGLLAQNPMINFRISSFRHRTALDYLPSLEGIVQLVRLILSECEAASLVSETGGISVLAMQRLLLTRILPRLRLHLFHRHPQLLQLLWFNRVMGISLKGKEKEKAVERKRERHFVSSSQTPRDVGMGILVPLSMIGLLPGNKVGVWLADKPIITGQNVHWWPRKIDRLRFRIRIVHLRLRLGASQRCKAKAKAQAKGVSEDALRSDPQSAGSAAGQAGSTAGSTAGGTPSKEDLVAEATRLLKGVSLRVVHVRDESSLTECGISQAWLQSVIQSASDQRWALIDSGATHGLRPVACGAELEGSKAITVDLASGATQLHINAYGTLLTEGPSQVIVPAGYLVEMGYRVSWGRKGCSVRHPKEGSLEVTVHKGCPLIPRELGLRLLEQYEKRCAGN